MRNDAGLAWHGLLSCLSSSLSLPLMSLSHAQKSVRISAEIEWSIIVVYNFSVLHNLQGIRADGSMLYEYPNSKPLLRAAGIGAPVMIAEKYLKKFPFLQSFLLNSFFSCRS